MPGGATVWTPAMYYTYKPYKSASQVNKSQSNNSSAVAEMVAQCSTSGIVKI